MRTLWSKLRPKQPQELGVVRRILWGLQDRVGSSFAPVPLRSLAPPGNSVDHAPATESLGSPVTSPLLKPLLRPVSSPIPTRTASPSKLVQAQACLAINMTLSRVRNASRLPGYHLEETLKGSRLGAAHRKSGKPPASGWEGKRRRRRAPEEQFFDLTFSCRNCQDKLITSRAV